jgi:hypothetical protein
MSFGFSKKGEEEKRQRIITNITDKEDLDEIKKIADPIYEPVFHLFLL